MFENKLMKLAISEAFGALNQGEVPVGSIIFDPIKNNVIGIGRNCMISRHDPTAHAEIEAIRSACGALKTNKLIGCYIYTTLEPCPMCASAISLAKIDRVYIGANDDIRGAISSLNIYKSNANLNHIPEVYEGIMLDECRKILNCFFAEKRKK